MLKLTVAHLTSLGFSHEEISEWIGWRFDEDGRPISRQVKVRVPVSRQDRLNARAMAGLG
jgi:hypothetical protein